jgi:D-serine deaminase-like pyridoxal phosphate-dependent protein
MTSRRVSVETSSVEEEARAGPVFFEAGMPGRVLHELNLEPATHGYAASFGSRPGGAEIRTGTARGKVGRLERATAELDPPFALIDMDAFWDNAKDLLKRAAGKPIRLASKSVRCRFLQERVLETEGFRGTLSFTLPEAIWLSSHGFDDIVVAYPTADRSALRELGSLLTRDPGLRLTLMVDSETHLDFIDSVVGNASPLVRVCIDIDAGLWLMGGRVQIGAKRSPLHSTEQAVGLARVISKRDRFSLVGLMAYESQVAGVGDAPPGRPLRGLAVRAMQKKSMAELADRRAAIVEAVREVADLEFVNGGGTGSVDLTAREQRITEVAAGSGLFAPGLFSAYSRFDPSPAALFALSVVRRPGPRVATVLGGGYIASGPADKARLPQPYLPEGLKLDPQEGAGEVQTPLTGTAADELHVGDRVYFRHAKAGEMCERFDRLYLIEEERIVDEVPTYRGEGRCFL